MAEGVWQRASTVVGNILTELVEKHVGLISAGVAFYAMLALFPALTAIIAVWGIWADPFAVRQQIDSFDAVMPAEVREILSRQLETIASTQPEALGWAGAGSILLSIWSARAGATAIIQALNAIYGVPARSTLGHYRAALGLTIAHVLIAVVALLAVVALPIVLKIVPLGPFAEVALNAVRWGLLLVVMIAGAGVVYRYGPNCRGERPAWITPGAVIAVLLWMAISAGFSAYLSAFGTYNETYGSLGAVIALLMWLYLSAFLLLFGAVINAELGAAAAETTRRGTPPGPRRSCSTSQKIWKRKRRLLMSSEIDVKPTAEKIDTGVRHAEAVAKALADVLAGTYRLVFKTHAYHWNVEGPLFYPIHKLTEEQYEDMFHAADELAERIRALGVLAPSRMADVVSLSVVEDCKELPSAIEMCEELASDHERVAHRMHALVKLAEENNDPLTADLATARSAFHEQAAWMLRATAQGA
jgi:membrane protein